MMSYSVYITTGAICLGYSIHVHCIVYLTGNQGVMQSQVHILSVLSHFGLTLHFFIYTWDFPWPLVR